MEVFCRRLETSRSADFRQVIMFDMGGVRKVIQLLLIHGSKTVDGWSEERCLIVDHLHYFFILES